MDVMIISRVVEIAAPYNNLVTLRDASNALNVEGVLADLPCYAAVVRQHSSLAKGKHCHIGRSAAPPEGLIKKWPCGGLNFFFQHGVATPLAPQLGRNLV